MKGNNFKGKKVVLLIFIQFWIRSHLNQLDRLTPQDIYYVYVIFTYLQKNIGNQVKSNTGCINIRYILVLTYLFWHLWKDIFKLKQFFLYWLWCKTPNMWTNFNCNLKVSIIFECGWCKVTLGWCLWLLQSDLKNEG